MIFYDKVFREEFLNFSSYDEDNRLNSRKIYLPDGSYV
jgi:hypothetical protein